MKLLENVIREHEGKPYPSDFAVQWKSLPTYADIAEVEAALADYELRLGLLARGATWEHDENERLSEELAALCARISRLEHLEMVAFDVNCWLVNNGYRGTAHQRELAAALAENG